PKISSGALPQTPAREWAENTNEQLGAHSAHRAPVGTPGAAVPGAFPAEHDSESADAGESSLLASAQSYLPAQADVVRALSAAKGYLPESVAAY
ncbi:hypothetical protein GGX14DRAFT_329869, partial [Mycena pura]